MIEIVVICISVVLFRCQNFIMGKFEFNVMQIDIYIVSYYDIINQFYISLNFCSKKKFVMNIY